MTNISHESFYHVRYIIVPWTDSFPPGPLIPTYLYFVLSNYGRGGFNRQIYYSCLLLLFYDMVHLYVSTYGSKIWQYISTYKIYQVHVCVQNYKGLFPIILNNFYLSKNNTFVVKQPSLFPPKLANLVERPLLRSCG